MSSHVPSPWIWILVTFAVIPDCSQKFKTHRLFLENKNMPPINCHCIDWYIPYFPYGMGILHLIFPLYGTMDSRKMANYF